jgi:hypothetical protein
MTTAATPLFQTFLPPQRNTATDDHLRALVDKALPPRPGGKKSGGIAQQAMKLVGGPPKKPVDYSSDPESDPAVQQARNLARYGHDILRLVRDDYIQQIEKWRLSFEHVVAAFRGAIFDRDRTLDQARRDREHEAAVGAFVLSLLTAGSMKLLSVYVEHRFIPSFTYQHRVITDLKVVPEVRKTFSAAQAAAFGGLVEEAGKELMGGLKPEPNRDFPQPPKSARYRLDTPDGVGYLQTDVNQLIGKSAAAVLKQFESVLTWMTSKVEFGQAWIAHKNGNLTAARAAVKSRLYELRERWAREWEFFGYTPPDFDTDKSDRRDRLAKHFERSLWADFATRAIRSAQAERKEMEKYRVPGTWSPWNYTGPEYTWSDPFIGRSVDEAVVDRLKQLNVVMGQTVKGMGSQLERMRRGEPYPGVEVKWAVDRKSEETALLAWAGDYLRRAPAQSVHSFIPPGVKRALPSLDG